MADEQGFSEAQTIIANGQVSTIIAIEMARRHQNLFVREELILHTDVNREEGTVYWHGLRLQDLEISWLRRIRWVKKLRLARNGFRSLSNEIGNHLKQVIKLDLQHNELTSIPSCLFELPNISELILSHNRLQKLPEIRDWSQSLKLLNLSHNKLTLLPANFSPLFLTTLNLSYNRLGTVPACVCLLTFLQNLDLSYNSAIVSFPPEMGRLQKLVTLNLEGMEHLTDPPRNLHKNQTECMKYLYHKFHSPRKFYTMKLLVLGNSNVGKSTLVSRLQGIEIDLKNPLKDSPRLNLSEWQYSSGFFTQKYTFNIYDFDGLDEYSAPICSYFFSNCSIYLLVWKIQDGEKGVAELRPWLDRISAFVNGEQSSCVLIIGTGLDLVQDENRPQIDTLLCKISEIRQEYSNKLMISEVLTVSLMNTLENVNQLKKVIYTSAGGCKEGSETGGVMGREIPASFIRLNKELKDTRSEVSQGLRPPIMSVENFKDLILALKLPDILNTNEDSTLRVLSTLLREPSLFLTEIGTVAYYDDKSYGLNELYFIDQNYLFQLIKSIITSPNIINGILKSSDLSKVVLTGNFELSSLNISRLVFLLSRYEIALPIDCRHILIPSMLPIDCPFKISTIYESDNCLCYSRYFEFLPGHVVPFGFWGRLFCCIIHGIPPVYTAFLKSLEVRNTKNLKEKEAYSNFEESLESNIELLNICSPNLSNDEYNDDKSGKLFYWKEGVAYKSLSASFCVKPLRNFYHENQGIEITTSSNKEGIKLMCNIIDIIRNILQNYFSIAKEFYEEKVPCYECQKTGCEKLYEFQVSEYMSSNITDALEVTCKTNNHTLSLKEIVPDLLLCDLNTENDIILKPGAVIFEQNESTINSAIGDIYYHGNFNSKLIAVKKYSKETSFLMFRNEVQLLYTSRNCPFIINMTGVMLRPNMVIVLESPPLGTLATCLIDSETHVSRIVIFRIATQIASALQFLHSHGIVYCNLEPSKVHVWSLDEKSLCHSKLAENETVSRLSPLGIFDKCQSTSCLTAPEVIYNGKYTPVFNHKIDVFSYGMLLYQMITRQRPFKDITHEDVISALLKGERPSFNSSILAENEYLLLIRLIKACWNDSPIQRPEMSDIIVYLLQVISQCIMNVERIPSKFSLRNGCHVLPSVPFLNKEVENSTDTSSTGDVSSECTTSSNSAGDLWICSDSSEGIEMCVYDIQTMTKRSKSLASGNQVQCVKLCGNHVWVCSRSGIDFGVIDIFKATGKHDLIHNIRLKENTVSCITCSVDEKQIYMGTLEGYCFSFDTDITAIQNNTKPHYCYISEHAIDGIIATTKHVWLSHTFYVFFLCLDTLKVEHSFKRDPKTNAFVGHLALPDKDSPRVWSAHLGGNVFSSWDAQKEAHLFDVNIVKVMTQKVDSNIKESDAIITCMTPALDVLWVGMATGHILLFHEENLLTFFRPYKVYVRFLIPIMNRSCETGKTLIVSGAKGFNSSLFDNPINSCAINSNTKNSNKDESGGVLIIWEAHNSNSLCQMVGIENKGSEYLNDSKSISKLVQEFGFNDNVLYSCETINESQKDKHDESEHAVMSNVAGLEKDNVMCPTSEEDRDKLVTEENNETTSNGNREDNRETINEESTSEPNDKT